MGVSDSPHKYHRKRVVGVVENLRNLKLCGTVHNCNVIAVTFSHGELSGPYLMSVKKATCLYRMRFGGFIVTPFPILGSVTASTTHFAATKSIHMPSKIGVCPEARPPAVHRQVFLKKGRI